MRFSRGERWALACYAVVVAGFMPPVMLWVQGVQAKVLGMPFLLLWAGIMVLVTAVAMTAALAIKDRVDGP